MSTKKMETSGSSKSKAKTKLLDTLPMEPSCSNPKPKALDTLAPSKPKILDPFAKSNSKKDMFSLAPSKPKMLDMLALAPSKPKTLDLLATSKGKNVPIDHTSGKSKFETPKTSKMPGSIGKSVVNQSVSKPKSAPPPPPPLDQKTLLELHYSRYLRTVLMNNLTQLEDQHAKKVIQAKESRLTGKKMQMEKERAALMAGNSDVLEKKRDIEEAETVENQYKPIMNLSGGVDEKLEKLTNVLEDKTSTLPVLNCELGQPIDQGPFEETISVMNVDLHRETEKLGAMVVRTSNDKESVADELEKVETDADLMHKLNAQKAILASMEAMVNEEYDNKIGLAANFILDDSEISD